MSCSVQLRRAEQDDSDLQTVFEEGADVTSANDSLPQSRT